MKLYICKTLAQGSVQQIWYKVWRDLRGAQITGIFWPIEPQYGPPRIGGEILSGILVGPGVQPWLSGSVKGLQSFS